MTGSFSVEDGRIVITEGSRTVSTTDGTLVCLLPTVQEFDNRTLTLPDFAKDEAYSWTTSNVLQPLSDPEKYQHGESCVSFITAEPQEYSKKTTLMAAPAGADFFIGTFRLSRTTAPQSSWMGRSLGVLPTENQWMPIPGAVSVLLEAEIGMARAMHIYIDDSNNLVLEAEQSVGAAMGGYSGSANGTIGFSKTDGLNYNDRGSILYKSTNGIPIFRRDSKHYGYTSPAAGSLSTIYDSYSRGGSSPCARGDTTVYTSVYSIDIRGRFGRRS